MTCTTNNNTVDYVSQDRVRVTDPIPLLCSCKMFLYLRYTVKSLMGCTCTRHICAPVWDIYIYTYIYIYEIWDMGRKIYETNALTNE